MDLYVQDGKKINMYEIQIKKALLENVQNDIDKWNGLGPIKEIVSFNVPIASLGRKIKIISCEYVKEGQLFDCCCTQYPLYKYRYYNYEQHPLSVFCSKLLHDYESLTLSEHMAISVF